MPTYSRATRVRKDVIGIIAHGQREWLHGNGLPIAEIHEAIDARIAEEISSAVQEAIFEYRRESGGK